MEKQGELVNFFISLVNKDFKTNFLKRKVKRKNSRYLIFFPKLKFPPVFEKISSPKCSLWFAAISIIFKSPGGKIQTKKIISFLAGWSKKERQRLDGRPSKRYRKRKEMQNIKFCHPLLYCFGLYFNFFGPNVENNK